MASDKERQKSFENLHTHVFMRLYVFNVVYASRLAICLIALVS